MRIACPQCSMQYDLDPRLLPPAGASVQCTHCSLVFTATPSGETLIPNPVKGAVSARTSAGTGTQVFGSPYAEVSRQGPPDTQTTQIFGAVPQPRAPRTSTAGSHLPPGGKTQIFAAPEPPAAPSAPPTTTQIFGAVPAPPRGPSVSTTQVFGAPAAAKAPPPPAPATTTQVFGAPEIAQKASPATTTQVFGKVSAPPQAPSAATTQVFGSAEVQGARKPAEAPWLAEPGPSPGASRGGTGERQAVAPPRTILELPQEPVALPAPEPSSPALPTLPPEPAVERSGPVARRAPSLELPPELMVPERPASAQPASARASGGGRERILIILAAVVALGLTAWLSYPVWRNRGTELPAEAVTAKDAAVSLVRRDDAASRGQAIEQLRALVARFPKYTEAQAELVVALALQLDDARVELDWMHREEGRLQKEIDRLELAKSPADWAGRVAERRQELNALGDRKRPLEAMITKLTQELDQAIVVIRAAPETEPSADVVARVKAQAIYEAVGGSIPAVALADRLKKVESVPHWSVLAKAEFGLNAHSPADELQEVIGELAEVRKQDQTFLRAYMLGARLALLQKDAATAQSLLNAVLGLNPNHALARTLQQWAASLPPPPAP